mmetsp:Transcript_20510/g.70970  ORF Transcript_20510/g.70970 Transcript_20510/m.70970 type:complete len:203 (+) Transcript_20510:2106-2714(+)
MGVAIEDTSLREREGEETDEILHSALLLLIARGLRKVVETDPVDELHCQDAAGHQRVENRGDNDVNTGRQHGGPSQALVLGLHAEVQFGLRQRRDVPDDAPHVVEQVRRNEGEHPAQQAGSIHVRRQIALHLPVLHLDHSLDLLLHAIGPRHPQRRAVHLRDRGAAQRRARVQDDLFPPILAQLLRQCSLHLLMWVRRHGIL